MQNQYGPWTTSLSAGGNPQLSAFWRRRLTMLVPASRTPQSLSSRNVLWLTAAAVLMILLPTVRFAAAADEGRSVETGNDAAVSETGEKPSSAKVPAGAKPRSSMYVGSVTMTGKAEVSNWAAFIPVIVYGDLSSEGARKELKLTSDQEKQLRDICGRYSKWVTGEGKVMNKAMEKRSADERVAALRDYQMKVAQEQKAVRKQIDEVLTAEQLKALRTLVIGSRGVGRLLFEPRFCEKVGLSEEQKKELSSRLLEDDAAKAKQQRLNEALKENQEKSLALITPKQWDEIEKIVGEDSPDYPGPELRELDNPNIKEKLALSPEQKRKAIAIFLDSDAQIRKLSKLVDEVNGPNPAKDRAAKSAEVERHLMEMRKHDRDQIEAMLTKQQLAVFRRLFIRYEFLNSLRVSRLLQGEGNEKAGILDRIHATAEQKKELRRLEDEADRLVRQFNRESGETAMRILSPQQQSRLFDELDRQPEPDVLNVEPAPVGKGGMSKVGMGSVVIFGAEVERAAKLDVTDDRGAAKKSGGSVELTIRVVEYKGDMMHSSVVGEGGAIYHPDTYDAAVCEILSPPAYAGQKLQIWGWNRQKIVDEQLRTKGHVVQVKCDLKKRRAPPWESGPTGFGQWEVQISKAPTGRP
jgi:hypothetical protein